MRMSRGNSVAMALAALLAAAAVSAGAGVPASAAGTYAVTAIIHPGSSPWGVAVDPAIRAAYVVSDGSGSVSVIDEDTDAVTATIGVGASPREVAVDPATRTAYVTDWGADTVSVIDEADNTVTATIGVGTGPWGVAVDPATRTGYVVNSGSDSVSVIDLADNKVTATVPVGSFPIDVAVDPGTHTAYVANDLGGGSVSVIDATDNKVTATIPVGAFPWGVAVDPATRTAFVTNSGDNSVSVIDEADRTVTATVPVGVLPNAAAVDPATGAVFVTNGFGGNVSVIDEATAAVTATIVTGSPCPPTPECTSSSSAPWGVAVNPVTHAAYVADNNSGRALVINGAKVPADCVPDVGACGYPDAETAGVPGPTALREVPDQVSSGPGWHFDPRGFVQVTGDGADLAGLLIPYPVNIAASGVTLQDDLLTHGIITGPSLRGRTAATPPPDPALDAAITLRHADDVTVEDTTISGLEPGAATLSAGIKDVFGDETGLRVLRDEIADTSTAIQVSAGLIDGDYIHSEMRGSAGGNVAGIESNGTAGALTIEHNTILVGMSRAYAIGLFPTFGAQASRLVDNNLLAGGNYVLYGGEAGGAGRAAASR